MSNRTRPRGFCPWSPREETAALVATVRDILAAYGEQLPLTLRQIFYVLVGRHGYDKSEAAYERLCETLNRARRAQMIPMDAIRDDGFLQSMMERYTDMENLEHLTQDEMKLLQQIVENEIDTGTSICARTTRS